MKLVDIEGATSVITRCQSVGGPWDHIYFWT